MWNKVKAYIDKHKLLNSNGLYLVALSGGADSVALLLLLKNAGYKIHAAHCNFKLRGAESERDEQFCITLCNEHQIPIHRVHFDTKTYAELHKMSVEMAARELRYNWFEKLRKDLCANDICVAHHRDDTVETVLLNLIRGTGLRGLTGIQPRNGHILRPLLCVSRHDIEQYLVEQKQSFVTDSTNLETDILRNKVRLDVLPLLHSLNPAIYEHIQHTTEHLNEAQLILDRLLEQYKNNKILNFSDINRYGSSEYFIYEWLKNYGFNGSQIPQILNATTGCVFSSVKGYDLLVNRDNLIIEPAMKPLKTLRIPEIGTYVLEDGTRLRFSEQVMNDGFTPSKDPWSITLDAKKVLFPLIVRRVEAGDWMIPYGMKGRKLLSDLMTDRKLSLFDKRRQLVVLDATGNVVWLVGIRTDNRYKVDESTMNICCIAVESPLLSGNDKP